eukprot:COSAG02_NODE_48138_length_336_cov_0.641350_1_plen_48_part_10
MFNIGIQDPAKATGLFGDAAGALYQTAVLRDYHVCRIEWRVNYCFVVS